MLKLMTGAPDLHPGGWRAPAGWDRPAMNFDYYREIAQTAERGLFDLILIGDGNAVRRMESTLMFEFPTMGDRPTVYEPLTFMSAMSQHTRNIGFAATATTTYDTPYLLARRFASADHLSGGRTSWNVVTGSYPGDALNFSHDEHVDKATRYARSKEFVEVCKGLWDSWAEDAFIQDKASGRFLDASRVHTLDHVGEHFQVKGPLNVSRSPQGYPVLFFAGQSEAGRELAAEHGDCVLAATDSRESGVAFSKDLKDRLDKYDRPPDSLKIFPPLAIYLGRSQAEADDLFDELNSLISPELGVAQLSKLLYMDLSGYPLDGPLPEVPQDFVGMTSIRDMIVDRARQEGLTIRQTYQHVVADLGYGSVKGDPTTVADFIEDWYRAGACDGLYLGLSVLPKGLHDFVELVVPELQRRGIYRTEYTGRTLRENLDFPAPKNPHFA
jgi:N-acetyl-S-(2-succino)cysteine monooxygenase